MTKTQLEKIAVALDTLSKCFAETSIGLSDLAKAMRSAAAPTTDEDSERLAEKSKAEIESSSHNTKSV